MSLDSLAWVRQISISPSTGFVPHGRQHSLAPVRGSGDVRAVVEKHSNIYRLDLVQPGGGEYLQQVFDIRSFIVRLSAPTLLGTASAAHACSMAPGTFNLATHVNDRSIAPLVFLAKVKSITPLPTTAALLLRQKIEFETIHWWRGKSRTTVVGIGQIEKPSGSSCDGIFNFWAKPGHEWLIVGYLKDSQVHPLPLMSQGVENGEVPPEVLRLLGAPR